MKSWLLVVALAFLCVQLASADVVLLSDKNYDMMLENSDLTLVKFYAPWCTHCQKLAPEYEAAAVTLKGKAVLGEVDCTIDKELCEDKGISGFPTIILFRHKEIITKFSGPRTAQGLVNFVESFRRPAVQTIASEKELKDIQEKGEPIALLVASSSEATIVPQFNSLADKHRMLFTFVFTIEKSVYPDAPLDQIVVLRPDESEVYEGDGSVESIESFLKVARVPFVGEISQTTITSYNEIFNSEKKNLPMGWIIVDTQAPELVKSLADVAKARRQKVLLVWTDGNKYPAVVSHVGIDANASLPAFSLKTPSAQFVFPADKPLNAESLGEFIDLSLSGQVNKSVRTEPPPAEATVNGLTTLTGSTINSYLQKTDMLILFYAPWCGHCKSFKPLFAEFAGKEASSNLVIAEFNAVANDYDTSLFVVEGFPTLYFVPVEGLPILYSGDRTFESLQRFVATHRSSQPNSGGSAADL